MDLYNKKFWTSEYFDEAFRKCSQYPLDQKEKYLRNTYIAYQLRIQQDQKQPQEAESNFFRGHSTRHILCVQWMMRFKIRFPINWGKFETADNDIYAAGF